MQELLIVNPSRRPSKRRKSTKAATPAQKRARAAFAAAARARAGKRRTKRKSAPAISIMSNPRKRRTRRHAARAHSRRRNPISLGGSSLKPMSILTPALIGALGAVTVNTLLGKLPIPAAAMTGKVKYATQAAAAIGLAMLAKKMGVKGSLAVQAAEGSLTVTLHQAIVDVAGGMGMNLSGMGYYLPGVGVRNAIPNRGANPTPMAMNGMGKYVTGPGSRNVVAMPMQRQGLKGITRGRGGFGF